MKNAYISNKILLDSQFDFLIILYLVYTRAAGRGHGPLTN
jgi:hypothetical protein